MLAPIQWLVTLTPRRGVEGRATIVVVVRARKLSEALDAAAASSIMFREWPADLYSRPVARRLHEGHAYALG